MLRDEGVPELLAVGVERRSTAGVRVDEGVRREDDRGVRPGREHGAGPGEPARARPPVERQDDPLTAGRGEPVGGVVAVGARTDPARGLPEPLRTEHVEVRGAAALVVGRRVDVVVAGEHAVGRTGTVEHVEDRAGRTHLRRRTVLRQVAEVDEEHRVVPGLLADDVLERGAHRRRVDRGAVEHVLRVRHHCDGEAWRGRVRAPPSGVPARHRRLSSHGRSAERRRGDCGCRGQRIGDGRGAAEAVRRHETGGTGESGPDQEAPAGDRDARAAVSGVVVGVVAIVRAVLHSTARYGPRGNAPGPFRELQTGCDCRFGVDR